MPPQTRIDELEGAIRAVCEPQFDRPLKDISLGQVLLRLFQTSRRFNVEIQPQLVLLQKTLLNIEGLGRELDPDLDLWSTAKPFLERWMEEQVGWAGLVRAPEEGGAALRPPAAAAAAAGARGAAAAGRRRTCGPWKRCHRAAADQPAAVGGGLHRARLLPAVVALQVVPACSDPRRGTRDLYCRVVPNFRGAAMPIYAYRCTPAATRKTCCRRFRTRR